jgi:hypothetical protein
VQIFQDKIFQEYLLTPNNKHRALFVKKLKLNIFFQKKTKKMSVYTTIPPQLRPP